MISINEDKIDKFYNIIEAKLKATLKSKPDSSKKIESYLKDKVKSYGNNNPVIHENFKSFIKPHKQYNKLTHKEKFALALKCLRSEYFDLKLTASNILGHIYKGVTEEEFDELNHTIKEEELINEWATSDCLVSKFYKFYGMMSKENTFAIAELRKSDFLWLRRISLVSFVNRVKKGDEKPNFKGFIDLMFTICDANKQYIERFNQLALGWLLREIAVVDYDRYEKWMKKNSILMTREAIRYTVEKITPKRKNYILSLKNNKDMENEEKHTKSKKKK